MFAKYRAQIGLGAFAIVFACSLAAVVAGYVSPTYPSALKVGDEFPSFALLDEVGVEHNLEPIHEQLLMIVHCPSRGLSDQQAMRITDLLRELQSKQVRSVAILDSRDNPAREQAARICDTVLMDPGQVLWPIRGLRDTDASISLIDQHGCLKMRTDLPPQESIPERPIDRPMVRKALAVLTDSLASR